MTWLGRLPRISIYFLITACTVGGLAITSSHGERRGFARPRQFRLDCRRPARKSLPVPNLPEGEVSLTGRVYVPSGKPLMMQAVAPASLPSPVQTLYWKNWSAELADLVGQPLLPFEVRIEPNSSVALTAEWPVVNQSSSQHIGYALQWFAMAAVLFLIGIWRLTNVGDLLGSRNRGMTVQADKLGSAKRGAYYC